MSILSRISRLFSRSTALTPEAAPAAAPAKADRPAMKLEDGFANQFRKPGSYGRAAAFFEPAKPAPGVLPKGQKLAMDGAFGDAMGWGYDGVSGLAAEGQVFLGYPELAVLAQRAEYRSIVETIATEMTRKWIKLTYTGTDEVGEPGEGGDLDGDIDSDGDGELDALETKDEDDGDEATAAGGESPYAERDEADPVEAKAPGDEGDELANDGVGEDLAKALQGATGQEGAEQDNGGSPNPELEAMRAEQEKKKQAQQEQKKAQLQAKAKAKSATTAKLRAIEDEFARLGVRDAFREITEQDGFFGRAHLYIDIDNAWNYPEELEMPIGSGSDATSLTKIQKGMLTRIKVVEPMWCYPSRYNSTDPLRDDWYQPHEWFVMGKKVDASRLLTFIGREVPDMLKPAYSFGGLSLTQMAKPYVENWLRTRQSVSDIVHSFSVFVLKTNMDNVLKGGAGANVLHRLMAFNAMRDNTGVMALDMQDEDFSNVSAPISGLHELQAQAQEQMAAVSKIPLVKLTGISPSGLNASSDGELRCFNDEIHSKQEALYRSNLKIVLDMVQLSLFGEVDPEIDFEFQPLYELTEKELAELRKTDVEAACQLIDHGVISPDEERQRIVDDDNSPYQGLDPADVPDLNDEQAGGLQLPGGEKGEGGAGPDGSGDEGGSGGSGGGEGGDPPNSGFGGASDAAKRDKFGFVCESVEPDEFEGVTNAKTLDYDDMAEDDAGKWDEEAHPRDDKGKFAKTASENGFKMGEINKGGWLEWSHENGHQFKTKPGNAAWTYHDPNDKSKGKFAQAKGHGIKALEKHFGTQPWFGQSKADPAAPGGEEDIDGMQNMLNGMIDAHAAKQAGAQSHSDCNNFLMDAGFNNGVQLPDGGAKYEDDWYDIDVDAAGKWKVTGKMSGVVISEGDGPAELKKEFGDGYTANYDAPAAEQNQFAEQQKTDAGAPASLFDKQSPNAKDYGTTPGAMAKQSIDHMEANGFTFEKADADAVEGGAVGKWTNGDNTGVTLYADGSWKAEGAYYDELGSGAPQLEQTLGGFADAKEKVNASFHTAPAVKTLSPEEIAANLTPEQKLGDMKDSFEIAGLAFSGKVLNKAKYSSGDVTAYLDEKTGEWNVFKNGQPVGEGSDADELEAALSEAMNENAAPAGKPSLLDQPLDAFNADIESMTVDQLLPVAAELQDAYYKNLEDDDNKLIYKYNAAKDKLEALGVEDDDALLAIANHQDKAKAAAAQPTAPAAEHGISKTSAPASTPASISTASPAAQPAQKPVGKKAGMQALVEAALAANKAHASAKTPESMEAYNAAKQALKQAGVKDPYQAIKNYHNKKTVPLGDPNKATAAAAPAAPAAPAAKKETGSNLFTKLNTSPEWASADYVDGSANFSGGVEGEYKYPDGTSVKIMHSGDFTVSKPGAPDVTGSGSADMIAAVAKSKSAPAKPAISPLEAEAQSDFKPSTHIEAATTGEKAVKAGYQYDWDQTNDDFKVLKKGDSTLHVDKKTGDWQLTTPPYQPKIGKSGEGFEKLMSGDKTAWKAAGVSIGSLPNLPAAKTAAPAANSAAAPSVPPPKVSTHEADIAAAKANKDKIQGFVDHFTNKGHTTAQAKALGVMAAMLQQHGSKDPVSDATDKLTQGTGAAKTLGHSMTPEQGAAVVAYKGAHYDETNKQLWKGSITPAEWAYSKLLSTALAKLPNHVGDVVRGVHSNVMDWDSYEVGKMHEERGFTSAGLTHKLWGDITFRIKAKTAKSIAKINGEGGGEVIFGMGTRFHVLKKDKASKTIWMEEDDDDF